jgi:hypothetical protein
MQCDMALQWSSVDVERGPWLSIYETVVAGHRGSDAHATAKGKDSTDQSSFFSSSSTRLGQMR